MRRFGGCPFLADALGPLVDTQLAHSLRMAGLGKDPVQGFLTLRDLHWEFLRLWTGFELPSSCVDLS
jgi:hypothetical protein